MIIRTKEQLKDVVQLLKKSLTWTYDIESDGLDTRNGRIIGFGCTNPDNYDESFYVIMKSYENGVLETKIPFDQLTPILNILKTKRLITFNGSFDTRFTLNYTGVNLIDSLYCDVMILVHTCNENRMSYRLKDIAADLLGDDAKSAQADMLESIKANGGSEKEYYKADCEIMAKYGLQDGILTAKLYNHYLAKLKSDGLFKFFFEDETMPLYRLVTIPMELRGIPVNMPLLENTAKEIEIDLQKIEDSIQSQIAPHLEDFLAWYRNKEYPIELSGLFLNTLAELIAPSDWPRTKAGGYSFSKGAFKKKQHLLETDLYKYQQGLERIPASLVTKVREELLLRSGVKYPFNISSKPHLKKLFFEQFNETPTSKTDLGNPQIEQDFLETMVDKYPWAKELITYNKLIKVRGTYIERFLKKIENGMFYPSFFQTSTVSGRYGSDFQQLPRAIDQEDIDAGNLEPIVKYYVDLVRQFFIAGEGYILVDDDYESLEPHVFAHVSGDVGLKNIFLKGDDFYSTIAIDTEGLDEYSPNKKAPNYLGKLNKSKRQNSKGYALSVPYGSTPYMLSKTLNVGEREAQQLYNNYLNAYPQLKAWMQKTDAFVKQNGFVRTETGRIRRYPRLLGLLQKHNGIDMTNHLDIWKEYHDCGHKEYEQAKEDGKYIRNCLNNAKNIQIQSLGASIINRASIALAKKLKQIDPNSYIMAQIHDQNIIRSTLTFKDEVIAATQDCMENTYKISIPLKAVPSTGKNMAESKG